MTEFVSDIKPVPHLDKDIYNVLSDLSNLELVKDKIPQDKIKDFEFDSDSCTITIDPIGKVRFVIVEREPNKTIKFEAEQLPFAVNLWIQVLPVSDSQSKMKITVKADLNPFLKPMVSKPLQAGLDKIADNLASLPYSDIVNRNSIENK